MQFVTLAKTVVLGALALIFLVAGVAHFVRRQPFIDIVPPILPYKEAIVLFTGVLEIAGGIGLLIPDTRRWTGIGLMLFLVAVFPANAYAARAEIKVGNWTHPAVLPRLLLQIVLIALIWWVTQTT